MKVCDKGEDAPKPNAGGGGNVPDGWLAANMGFELAWPSAAYEDVIESMTDCAFSWPISVI